MLTDLLHHDGKDSRMNALQKLAEDMVTVVPNITGERAELWLCGTFCIDSSEDVEDVLSAARHMREDIAAFLQRSIPVSEEGELVKLLTEAHDFTQIFHGESVTTTLAMDLGQRIRAALASRGALRPPTCPHSYRGDMHPKVGHCCATVYANGPPTSLMGRIPIDYCNNRLPCSDHPARAAEEKSNAR